VADPPVMKQEISRRKVVRPNHPSVFSHLREIIPPQFFHQKGYSLIEMLIVFALIGILTTLAVPQFNIWTDHYRLNGATRLVWGDLQHAKMTAIKNNQSVTVIFDTTTSYSFSQAGSTIFTRNLTQEYPTITVVKTGGGVLTFGPTGLTQNATITIQGWEKTKSVTTLWTGRIIST
jgi:prepilin-type N-terminal cleavage/methylation domain-containing protein